MEAHDNTHRFAALQRKNAAAGESGRAATAGGVLRDGLLAGQWRLRRETFEWYWSEANRFRHVSDAPPTDLIEFASTVEHIRGRLQRASPRNPSADESFGPIHPCWSGRRPQTTSAPSSPTATGLAKRSNYRQALKTFDGGWYPVQCEWRFRK
jgi:hypothetical protein